MTCNVIHFVGPKKTGTKSREGAIFGGNTLLDLPKPIIESTCDGSNDVRVLNYLAIVW